MIFGIQIFGTTWLIVSAIIGVIGLTLVGFFWEKIKEDVDDGAQFGAIVAVILFGLFWLFVLLIICCVGIVALPVWIGYRTQKTKESINKARKERFNKKPQTDKIMEKRL